MSRLPKIPRWIDPLRWKDQGGWSGLKKKLHGRMTSKEAVRLAKMHGQDHEFFPTPMAAIERIKAAIKLIEPAPLSVLDIGAGDGKFLKALAVWDRLSNPRLLAIEIAPIFKEELLASGFEIAGDDFDRTDLKAVPKRRKET